MQQPIILLYCNVFDNTVGQSKAYMKFFSQFGDVVLVTSEMDLPRMIDLGHILAVPGGQDINSNRYGVKPGFNSKEINVHYEYLDEHLLLPWIETKKPIIGICRGMQALNVVCGGTLHRHIDGHVQDDDKYWRYDTPQMMYTGFTNKNGQLTHPVVPINSLHHQAVNKVAPGFKVLGWSDYEVFDKAKKKAEFSAPRHYYRKKDGDLVITDSLPMVPEIIEHETRPYIAFQYHPEEFNCEIAITLIESQLNYFYANTNKEKAEEEATTAAGGSTEKTS